jgi:hypothetical protein
MYFAKKLITIENKTIDAEGIEEQAAYPIKKFYFD